jgi:hypothetical protein
MGFPRWAPLTWYIFHKLSNEYNQIIDSINNDTTLDEETKSKKIEEYKIHYVQFFQSMKTIIPCKTCRNHFIQNTDLEENKIEKNINKDTIFPWTIRLHNLVNKMHNKKLYTVDEANKMYATPLNNQKLYSFMNDYMMYNLNKGVDKDRELLNMMTQLCYLYPNKLKREKLISFVEKMPIQKEKLRQWLTVFYAIVNKN